MSTKPRIQESRSRAVPIAMILFALLAEIVGPMDPGAGAGQSHHGQTSDQLQLIRADLAAGFPAPPHPDNPPRGPGG